MEMYWVFGFILGCIKEINIVNVLVSLKDEVIFCDFDINFVDVDGIYKFNFNGNGGVLEYCGDVSLNCDFDSVSVVR